MAANPDTEPNYDSSTVKPKKNGNISAGLTHGYCGPTTFFLKSEKEMEKEVRRGRHASRSSADLAGVLSGNPAASTMGDSSFGVQSLEETISSAFPSGGTLSRTNSNSSVEERSGNAPLVPHKRKAGNTINTKVSATGHRILSHERMPALDSYNGSPISLRSSNSPSRGYGRRRGSVSSSINISQPMTPLKISSHPEHATPSTTRSASPKSFRLSDEDADETNSQALMSSSGDEDDVNRASGPMPQLVMPSLTMPPRRPFTEIGRNMGRARFMLVGPKSIGKTSLIQSIFRTSEHIVHVDSMAVTESSKASIAASKSTYQPTTEITEVLASTRPYPSWWTSDSVRVSQSRQSFGDGVLERNLAFIDTPGIGDDADAQTILDSFQSSLLRTSDFDSLSEAELVRLLSGDGGNQIDAVIYMFDPNDLSTKLSPVHRELFQALLKYTNVIPVIGKADTVTSDLLSTIRGEILSFFESNEAKPCLLAHPKASVSGSLSSDHTAQEPFAISSATGDDTDIIDASVLMSSQYLQPLLPSDLPQLVETILSPSNIRMLRHLAASKFITWRRESKKSLVGLKRHMYQQSPSPGGYESPGSLYADPNKVVVPYGSTSYYRSASPSISEMSALSSTSAGANPFAIAKYNEQTQPSEPFRQVRLAKWAQDLQRSLHNESRRYREMYQQYPAEWNSEDDSEKQDGHALVTAKDGRKPARGRLGGDLGVIDPRDPLGVLALGQTFRAHGLIALQIASSFGLLGAAVFWVVRHWTDVQEFLGLGQPVAIVQVAAVPPPSRPFLEWFGESNLRGLFSWG